MTQCSHPGCHSNDTINNDTLYFEYMDHDDSWVPVCVKHIRDDRHNIKITDEMKDVRFDVMTHIKDELTDN